MPFLAEKHVPIESRHLVSWVFDGPAYDENEPIYIDAVEPSRSISRKQALSIVRKLVAGFHAAGLKKNDVVVIASNNDIYYSMIFLGVIAAGGILSSTNPNYTHYELCHQLKLISAKYILAEPGLLKKIEKAADESGVPRSAIYAFEPRTSDAHGFRSWQELLQHGEKSWDDFKDPEQSHETAAYLFSSGTTGMPKAAQISHRNFIAQHTLVWDASRRPSPVSRIIPLPMFHVAMAPVAHTTPLRNGQKSYVMEKFHLETYLWAIDKYQITDLAAVAPVIIAVINSPLTNTKYSLKSVKRMTTGAAPLREGPQARMQAMLPSDAPLTQVWGMTETTCILTRFEYPEWDTTASVGYPLPNCDVKLVDDDGKDITDYDVRGEFCVRGPIVIKGYLKNENKEFDDDGYFHTGDICICDRKTKKWYIVDRKKELIKVRGFQVAPPELEGVLLTHPDIVDAAVIGVPFKDTEAPRAYVVRKAGSKITEDEAKKHISDRLVYYKRLDGGVQFVDSIPRNPSGKILKRVLREQLARETGAKL